MKAFKYFLMNVLAMFIIILLSCNSAKVVPSKLNNRPTHMPMHYQAEVKPKALLAQQTTVVPKISTGQTRVRIFLDSLENGVQFDTTIIKNNTVTSYSFTPQINTWGQTDTSYYARYFLTIDVYQEFSSDTKVRIAKKLSELEDDIKTEQDKLNKKMQAREAVLKLSKN